MIRTSLLAFLSMLALAAPAVSHASGRAADLCLEPGETPVHLTATDGAKLYGVAVGSGSLGVVLVHQSSSSHCEFMSFARELADRGYRALAIDLRGNGASRGGDPRWLDRDVAAAVAHLRAEGATSVKLVGASMGATAVLVAASKIVPSVDGVVSLSAPSRYNGLDAVRAVRRSSVPVRFVVAKADRSFASDAQALMRAAAAKDKAILRLTGGAHGSSLVELPRGKSFVLGFLAR